MIIDVDIEGAIERAAAAGDNSLTNISLGSPSVVSDAKLLQTREAVRRFLESVPAELSVAELIEAMDVG